MRMPAIIGVSKDTSPQVKFMLPIRFKEADGWVVALCEPLDVASQGKDRGAAKSAIIEAVSLFLETCFEMGTLDEVLHGRGFTRMQPPGDHVAREQEMIEVPMELVANAKAHAGKLRTSC